MVEQPLNTASEKAGTKEVMGAAVRDRLSQLGDVLVTILSFRKELAQLRDENKELRQRLDKLTELVHHQQGQIKAMENIFSTQAELQVRKQLDAIDTRIEAVAERYVLRYLVDRKD
jgi:TolA-binding protein